MQCPRACRQMQLNGKGFGANFRQLANLGVVNGLYRAFPAAMIGAAPKAVVHYGFLNYWINFHTTAMATFVRPPSSSLR